MSDTELRELAVMYYAISREDETALGYEIFLSVFIMLTEEQRTCFISDLRQRYREIVERSVSIGQKVLEKYLEPE